MTELTLTIEYKNDKGEVIATDTQTILAGRTYNVPAKKLEGYKETAAQTGNMGVEDKTIVVTLVAEQSDPVGPNNPNQPNQPVDPNNPNQPDQPDDPNTPDDPQGGDDDKGNGGTVVAVIAIIVLVLGGGGAAFYFLYKKKLF